MEIKIKRQTLNYILIGLAVLVLFIILLVAIWPKQVEYKVAVIDLYDNEYTDGMNILEQHHCIVINVRRAISNYQAVSEVTYKCPINSNLP